MIVRGNQNEISSCRAIHEKGKTEKFGLTSDVGADIGRLGRHRRAAVSVTYYPSSNALHCRAPCVIASKAESSCDLQVSFRIHWTITRIGHSDRGYQRRSCQINKHKTEKHQCLFTYLTGWICGVNHWSVRHIILRKPASPEREICWKSWDRIWPASDLTWKYILICLQSFIIQYFSSESILYKLNFGSALLSLDFHIRFHS